MNLLNKLTIKNLKLNKKRTIVTIIGIILSVALITAVASIYCSGIASLIKFETQQKGNFHIAFYKVPINEVETIKNNRDVENLYITQDIGYARLADSKNEYKPYAFIKSFTKDALENLSIKLVDGRLPEKDGEIAIPTHLKTNGRVTLNVGDVITLDVGKRVNGEGYELNQNNPYHPYEYAEIDENAENGEVMDVESGAESDEKIIETSSITYKIVGIIERPASNIESYDAPGYTFITFNNEDYSESDYVDVYARYTKSGTKNTNAVTSSILGVSEETLSKLSSPRLSAEEYENVMKEMESAKYSYNENDYLIMLETDPLNIEASGGLSIVAMIVCGIIVLTSVFCIKNSFDISITEKIRQYGMLRSIGATKKQIKRNVFYEATILGIIGIPLGILSGFLASYILIIVSNHFLAGMFQESNLKLIFSFSWIAVVVALLLGIVTIYLSAIRSALKAAKVSPIDSIRNSANIKIKSKKLRSSKIINKIFGIGGDISYKNLKRNKKKYRTTVISIVVSVFVFIALYSFMNLAFVSVDNELNISDYNMCLSVAYTDSEKNIYEKALETTKLDNIRDYTVYRSVSLQMKNPQYDSEYKQMLHISEDEDKSREYINMSALGEEQYKKYITSLGLNYDEMKDKAILCDNVVVNVYDAKKDKNVDHRVREFSYNKGDTIVVDVSGRNELQLDVGYVTDELPFGLKNAKYNSIMIVSDQFFDEHAECHGMYVYYDSSNAGKLQDDIEEVFKDVNNYYLNNMEENVKIMKNLYTLIGIFLYGFIIVISLIGITNIFNTITTNMELRRQEFAMLKSIGMTKKEFNRMIRLESIFMGVKSLVFGIPIGVGLSYAIYSALAEGSGVEYEFPFVAVGIAVLAVFLLIFGIMRYSLGKIRRQNIIETIRNENI